MIIRRTRHRIESTSLLDMNHRYIKGILSAPKVSWEVNLYLGLRAFHRQWSLGVQSKQSSIIGGLRRLFTIPPFVPHIIKVALRGLTLLIHLRHFTHVSNIFMYLHDRSCENPKYPRHWMPSFVCNPSWFACNISYGRMLPTCAFFCQCSWCLCFVPNFWISSRVVQWKCRPSSSSLSSSSSPLSCSHCVVAASFLWIFPVYITEHIRKYCSIENFIKLPFPMGTHSS
jgi:hypothetical protein